MTDKTPAQVTEEALLKSIKDLETPKTVVEDPVAAAAVVQPVIKPAAEVVAAGATAELKKALDVSTALTEFAGLIGAHVDTSLEILAKSIKASGERDLAILTVLTDLKKSIDANTAAVKAYGDKPQAAKTQVLGPDGKPVVEALNKSLGAPGGEPKTLKPAELKARVLSGLEILAKSATSDSDRNGFINTAVKFESTGEITDAMMGRAVGAWKQATAKAA